MKRACLSFQVLETYLKYMLLSNSILDSILTGVRSRLVESEHIYLTPVRNWNQPWEHWIYVGDKDDVARRLVRKLIHEHGVQTFVQPSYTAHTLTRIDQPLKDCDYALSRNYRVLFRGLARVHTQRTILYVILISVA